MGDELLNEFGSGRVSTLFLTKAKHYYYCPNILFCQTFLEGILEEEDFLK
jgi:hypothetical protein